MPKHPTETDLAKSNRDRGLRLLDEYQAETGSDVWFSTDAIDLIADVMLAVRARFAAIRDPKDDSPGDIEEVLNSARIHFEEEWEMLTDDSC